MAFVYELQEVTALLKKGHGDDGDVNPLAADHIKGVGYGISGRGTAYVEAIAGLSTHETLDGTAGEPMAMDKPMGGSMPRNGPNAEPRVPCKSDDCLVVHLPGCAITCYWHQQSSMITSKS